MKGIPLLAQHCKKLNTLRLLLLDCRRHHLESPEAGLYWDACKAMVLSMLNPSLNDSDVTIPAPDRVLWEQIGDDDDNGEGKQIKLDYTKTNAPKDKGYSVEMREYLAEREERVALKEEKRKVEEGVECAC